MNSSAFSASALSGTTLVTVRVPRSTGLALVGPGLGGVVGRVARLGELGQHPELCRRPWRPAGRSRPSGSSVALGRLLGGEDLLALHRHEAEAERLPLAGRVDEDEGVDAVIGLPGEARRGLGGRRPRSRRPDGRRRSAPARSDARRSGRSSATAFSRSRNSSPVATGKYFSALVTTSISEPSLSLNLSDRPCGLASATPSGMVGTPVASEKRTVTGTAGPLNSEALLSLAASATG